MLHQSWNPLDHWNTAANGLQPEDLRRITRQAKDLKEVIERLRAAPFVHSLSVLGEIDGGDLLNWRCNLDKMFGTLLKLPELAKRIGPRAKPDFNEALDRLIAYVGTRWRYPMFTALEEVLNGLGIEVNLKQRKYDQRRASRKVRPKAPNSENRLT
jgi:hypothetical protein